jgi:hypothetical protein
MWKADGREQNAHWRASYWTGTECTLTSFILDGNRMHTGELHTGREQNAHWRASYWTGTECTLASFIASHYSPAVAV